MKFIKSIDFKCNKINNILISDIIINSKDSYNNKYVTRIPNKEDIKYEANL